MPCLGETGVVKENYAWEIAGFFSLPTTAGDSYESPAFHFAGEKWSLGILPGGDSPENSGYVSAYLKKRLTKTECSVQFSIALRKADGSLLSICNETWHTFQSDPYGIPKFFSRLELTLRRMELAAFEVLTIVCTMRQGVPHPATFLASNMKFSELDLLSKNFQDLLSDEKSCDVTLVVKGKSFRVHKSVLIARSSVFSATFEHEMSENETGTVDIPDCDEDSFGTFLEYLYSGRVENVSFVKALHLYRTAHKYDVQELKSFCLKFLDGNMSVEGVIDAVNLADEYDEDDLMSSAQDFFNSNFGEVLQTKQWDSLNRQNFRLANKLNKGMAGYVSALKRPDTKQANKSLGIFVSQEKKLQHLNNVPTTTTTTTVAIPPSSTHPPATTSFSFGLITSSLPATKSSTTVEVTPAIKRSATKSGFTFGCHK